MTAAEKLKQEMRDTFPWTKEQFIDMLCKDIKVRGRIGFICDTHIDETLGNAIAMKHEQIAINYAISEGFSYHYDYNSYGVRKLIFSL